MEGVDGQEQVQDAGQLLGLLDVAAGAAGDPVASETNTTKKLGKGWQIGTKGRRIGLKGRQIGRQISRQI